MQKLKSVKTWALLFCCCLLTYIVVSNKTEFLPIAQVLSFAPISYFAANEVQKFILNRKEE